MKEGIHLTVESKRGSFSIQITYKVRKLITWGIEKITFPRQVQVCVVKKTLFKLIFCSNSYVYAKLFH